MSFSQAFEERRRDYNADRHMQLVRSSIPGAVERDAALRRLSERAVLTRTLCRELFEAEELPDRRVDNALAILLTWIASDFPEDFADPTRRQPRPSHGLDQMTVPEEARHLLAEIADGAQVGEALFRLNTADTSMDADQDEAILRERLESYWAKHRVAVRPPWFVDGKWMSTEGD